MFMPDILYKIKISLYLLCKLAPNNLAVNFSYKQIWQIQADLGNYLISRDKMCANENEMSCLTNQYQAEIIWFLHTIGAFHKY